MSDDENRIIVDLLVDGTKGDKTLDEFDKKTDNIAKKSKQKKLVDFEAIKDEATSAFDDLTGGFGKLGTAAIAAGAVIYGIKKALDFSVAGEQIQAVNAQFEIFATNAKIIPNELRQGLLQAADGMVGMESILRSSTSAIINLGESANRLPQIMELSRKITAALGGDIQQRFTGIVEAIEAGNAKALKNQGITLDVDKAYRTYAATLGLTTAELNQSQKQQALLNAVLETGNERFGKVNTSIQPVRDNLARIKEAINDIGDGIKTAVSNSGVFKMLTDKLVEISKGAPATKNNLTTEIAGLIARRAAIQNEINYLSKNLGVNPNFTRAVIEEKKMDMARLSSEIAASGMIIKQNNAEMVAEAKKAAAAQTKVAGAIKGTLDAAQQAAIRSRDLSLEQAKLDARMSQNQTGSSATVLIKNEWDRRLELVRLYSQRESMLLQQYNLQVQQLAADRAANSIRTETEYQTRLIQLKTEYAAQQASLDLARQQAMMEYTGTAVAGITGMEAVLAGFEETMKGAKDGAKEFALSAATNFRNMGKQLFTSIGNGAAQAFAAFGQAIATGQNALEAFANALLAQMGQMAIQLGAQFILQGAAYTWAGMPNGPALMAAGAALAAFGGVLSGLSGGAPSTGGGVSNSPDSSSAKIVEPSKLERKEPDTHINLTVEGSVFDSEETGFRIADILNELGGKNGVKLVHAGI